MTRRAGRLLRAVRHLVVAAAVGTVLGAGVLGASPAQAATYDCPPMSSSVCKTITPVAECVWDNKNGTSTALWGWNNPTTDTARIAVGNKNSMSPSPANQGQPTLFPPGRARNIFTTTYSGSSASWRLGNSTVQIDKNVPACATKPVPQLGSVGPLLVVGVALLVGMLLIASARPRPQVVHA